jgi:hypothetical protein
MAGILELLRGTTDPTTPGTGLGDIYFKGASDAAMLLCYRRPDGTVVELASSSGTLTSPTIQGTVNPGTGLTMPAFVLSGNITQTGNPSLNIGSGALTAGATSLSDALTITGVAGAASYVSNTTNSGISGAVVLQRSGVVKGYIGLDASDRPTMFDNSATARVTATTGGAVINGALDVGSGALTAGATGVTTLTASGDISTSQSNAGNFYGLQSRNTNAGAAAANGFAVGNNSSAFGLTMTLNSSAFTGAANYAYLLNQFNAPLILGANGAGVVTINASGMNGVLGATTPAAASVTTLTASGAITITHATAAQLNMRDADAPTYGAFIRGQFVGGGGGYAYIGVTNASAETTAITIAESGSVSMANGLAVTGALSATGVVSGQNFSGGVSGFSVGGAADGYSTGLQVFGSGGGVNAHKVITVIDGVGPTTTTSSTGFAVTGALSATGNITISTNNKFLIGKTAGATSVNMIGVDSANMTQLGSNTGEVVKTVVISPPVSDAARAGGFMVDSGNTNRFVFYDKDGNRFYVTGTTF